MDKTFEHYHLSLVERAQPDLLVPAMGREAWIRDAFAQKFEFQHYGSTFWWVPSASSDGYITGIAEREKARTQHRGPEGDAAEFIGKEWQGSLVLIDPKNRPDGQKVAFERDGNVGTPAAILDSLVDAINARPGGQYTILVKALFDSEGFWAFASRHGGVVKYVTFDFVVPNMFFGASTSVDTGLRRLGKDTGAQTVRMRLESDDGVQADSQSVTDAMAYAEEGNASVTAQAINGDRYSSTRRRRTSRVQTLIQTGEKVQQWIARALGQDEVASDPSIGSGDGGGG